MFAESPQIAHMADGRNSRALENFFHSRLRGRFLQNEVDLRHFKTSDRDVEVNAVELHQILQLNGEGVLVSSGIFSKLVVGKHVCPHLTVDESVVQFLWKIAGH
jgi:hypothetical protein